MGLWDFINSGKETVKWHTPELVKKACNTSYNYSAAAITKIDNVVRELGQCMPDDQDRAKIVSFSTKFAKNASVYAVKEAATYIIPGGRAVAKIYSETVREVETEQKKQDKSCIKESIGDSNKNTTSDGPLRLLEVESRELELGSENIVQVDSFAYQTPEDAIRVFMMKEFIGTRYLDNLLVPDHGKKKKM